MILPSKDRISGHFSMQQVTNLCRTTFVFLAMISSAGFEDVGLVRETGFNSSGKTKGVLIKALKASVRK
jgi:hypothetical protein